MILCIHLISVVFKLANPLLKFKLKRTLQRNRAYRGNHLQKIIRGDSHESQTGSVHEAQQIVILCQCYLVLLITDEDHRPSDRQQGQNCHNRRGTQNTGLSLYRIQTRIFHLWYRTQIHYQEAHLSKHLGDALSGILRTHTN